jgi:hypothetical protein
VAQSWPERRQEHWLSYGERSESSREKHLQLRRMYEEIVVERVVAGIGLSRGRSRVRVPSSGKSPANWNMSLTYRPRASSHPAQIPHENRPEIAAGGGPQPVNPRRRMAGHGSRRSEGRPASAASFSLLRAQIPERLGDCVVATTRFDRFLSCGVTSAGSLPAGGISFLSREQRPSAGRARLGYEG